jgi:hypothetical protein
VLQENKLYAKLSNCDFFKPELHLLGYVVGADGVQVNPDKTKAVLDWVQPTSMTEVRSFLGLTIFS